MIKYKNQLPLLLAACLIYTSASVYAAGQNQLTGTDVYSSAGTGTASWENSDLTAPSPDSDLSNQDAYKGFNAQGTQIREAMPFNRNPLTAGAQQEYTGNSWGKPSFDPTPTTLSPGPGAHVPVNQFGTTTTTLPNTSTRLLTPLNPRVKANPNGLPPTLLDSFVSESGGDNSIYGDEGQLMYPTMGSFNTISSGFDRQTREGLTTGHGSWMPSAWGFDGVQNDAHNDPQQWNDSAPRGVTSEINNNANNQNAPALHIVTN